MAKQYTESEIIDFLTQASSRVLRGDANGIDWVFFHCMDQQARLAFDLFLVRTDDPLAYEVGTTEYRFKTRVNRMVELERQRRTQKETRPRG